MKRLLLMVVASIAVTGTAAAFAATHVATSARLVSATSPARRNSYATLVAHVVPAQRCTIAVLYKSGPSEAQGLTPKHPEHGRVSWTWKVGGNTTLGKWPIEVSCGSSGSFRTRFQVIH